MKEEMVHQARAITPTASCAASTPSLSMTRGDTEQGYSSNSASVQAATVTGEEGDSDEATVFEGSQGGSTASSSRATLAEPQPDKMEKSKEL